MSEIYIPEIDDYLTRDEAIEFTKMVKAEREAKIKAAIQEKRR